MVSKLTDQVPTKPVLLLQHVFFALGSLGHRCIPPASNHAFFYWDLGPLHLLRGRSTVYHSLSHSCSQKSASTTTSQSEPASQAPSVQPPSTRACLWCGAQAPKMKRCGGCECHACADGGVRKWSSRACFLFSAFQTGCISLLTEFMTFLSLNLASAREC